MQHNPPQEFREDIRLIGANETVNVSLAKLNAAGTALTLNDDAVAMTIDGTQNFTGLITVTGGIKAPSQIDSGASLTLTSADSGKVVICSKTSATQTYTLPSAATPGLTYTFVTTSAAGEVLINPVSLQNFQLKASEGGASVVTAASTGCKNTAATNVVGDSITVVSDGLLTWIAINQSGIWATQ